MFRRFKRLMDVEVESKLSKSKLYCMESMLNGHTEDIERLHEDLDALAKALGYTFHTKPEVPEERIAIKDKE